MDQKTQPSAPRRRGRPPGTGLDDSATLTAVADILQANPGMKATSAMRRHAGGTATDSDLRRLQVKWKAEGGRLLAEAGTRARERERQRQQDLSRTSAMTAAAMAVHIIGIAHPALASGERHALMLGITEGLGQARSSVLEATRAFQEAGRIGQAYSAYSTVLEATRAFQESGRLGQAHDIVSKYACATAFPGADLIGSAASALNLIAGATAETAVSKHLREMIENVDRFTDPCGFWRRS